MKTSTYLILFATPWFALAIFSLVTGDRLAFYGTFTISMVHVVGSRLAALIEEQNK